MSIRVNSQEVALTQQTGRTEQPKPTGPGNTGSVSGKTSEDHIEVSATTANINFAIAAQNLQHAQRVKQLGSLVADGRYSLSSADLSRAIVSSAITSSGPRPGRY